MDATLTVWDAKERAGLLAIETEEWREKRLLAQDPDTPGETLARLATNALSTYNDDFIKYIYEPQSGETSPLWKRNHLLFAALAAHPNTPPALLARLCFITCGARAFCRNPIVPFLLLERPDFVSTLGHETKLALLREADTPPQFIQMLAVEVGFAALHFDIPQSAQMHVSFAGEVASVDEGRQQITAYWRAHCSKQVLGDNGNWEGDTRDRYIDTAEAGLAPAWAAGKAPREPSYTPPFVEALEVWFRWPPVPDSREERNVLRRIDPQLRNVKLLARGLRVSATPADLFDLLRAPEYNTRDISNIVKRAVMRHPNATAEMLQEIAGQIAGEPSNLNLDIACHPKASSEMVARLLQSEVPLVRRLARRHPNAPYDTLKISREAALRSAQPPNTGTPPFLTFIAALHGTQGQGHILQRAGSGAWTKRLEAVLVAGMTNAPLFGDLHERTGIDLLKYLAHDGNRLVRWAAQTRLADPDFTFTWHE